MMDAERFQEYGKARISNATFICPEYLLEEDRLKAGLNDAFARLNTSRSLMTYSDDVTTHL